MVELNNIGMSESQSHQTPNPRTTGNGFIKLVWRVLEFGWAYKLFRAFAADNSFTNYLVTQWYRVEPTTRVLDLGCGTGDTLQLLPEFASYEGHDINPDYIRLCQERFGDRGLFIQTDLSTGQLAAEGKFDLALLVGVLHHLDDEACLHLLRNARRALRPGGRLVTLDGVFHPGQRPLSRFVVSLDRGRHVRCEEDYLKLVKQVFPQVRHEVCEGRIRIPYSHILIAAQGGESVTV